MPGRSGEIWHGLLPARQAAPGTLYAYCVHGPNQPENGQRFDSTVPLIDPYAYALSKQWPLRSQVIDHAFDWGDDRPPTIPWRDSVIYELHVKGMTKLHPAVAQQWRGKYLGLSVGPVIQHLKSIGVTAVELLPCQAFVSEQFLRECRLSNYWGYNQIAWFAPANEYALQDAVAEFKTMVKALHAAGIEVIMDVVFNHTAEGGEAGPLLSLRGIDNSVYYRLTPGDLRVYENVTGTGNTVNCEHPQCSRTHHRLLEVLGRGNACRWVSLRSGDRVGPRRQRLQPASRFFQGAARRTCTCLRQADRGALGCGLGRLPARAFSARVVGVE